MNAHPHLTLTAKGARTRTGILRAALSLFAERGYAPVTLPDIAAKAGVAPATIYRHFTSKHELVNTVFSDAKHQLMGCLFDEHRGRATSRERFAAVWRGLARYAVDEPDGFAFLELHHHGEYLSAENVSFETRSLEMFARILLEGSAAGEIKGVPPATLIIIVWSSWVGLVKAARQKHITLDEATLADAELCCWDAIAAHPG